MAKPADDGSDAWQTRLVRDQVAADFYTGIVVDVYRPLRGSVPDAAVYSRFIRKWGEPALELGCGDGDPLLPLRSEGLDVEGLDSSADMLNRLRERAAADGVDATVHLSTIEEMELGRTFRSVFLAGPTFNLLPDDATASRALARIRDHLDPQGAALIPLFVPDPVTASAIGVVREHVEPGGRILRVTATASERDEAARRQVTTLRYEVVDGGDSSVLERPWVLHWYTPDGFRQLAEGAGLLVESIRGPGAPEDNAVDSEPKAFTFVLRRPADSPQ